MSDNRDATVLVISDDAELGGLIALNLRQRGYRVEHTDLLLALSPRWAPSNGHPHLLVVHLEAPNHMSPARLRQLTERPWARGVPLVLAVDDSVTLFRLLEQKPDSVVARSSDVATVIKAVRELLTASPAA